MTSAAAATARAAAEGVVVRRRALRLPPFGLELRVRPRDPAGDVRPKVLRGPRQVRAQIEADAGEPASSRMPPRALPKRPARRAPAPRSPCGRCGGIWRRARPSRRWRGSSSLPSQRPLSPSKEKPRQPPASRPARRRRQRGSREERRRDLLLWLVERCGAAAAAEPPPRGQQKQKRSRGAAAFSSSDAGAIPA